MSDIKTCPYCAEQIQKAARICPHCRKKVQTSGIVWGGGILLAGLLLSLGLADTSWFSASNPFRKASASKPQSPIPVVPKPAPSPAEIERVHKAQEAYKKAAQERRQLEDRKQSQRQKMIQRLINQGYVQKLDCRDTGATLHSRPSFLLGDFEDKQALANMALTYCFSGQRPPPYTALTIRDTINGHNIGDFTFETGLRIQ